MPEGAHCASMDALLVHVDKCTGQAMTGVWGLPADPLETQPQ